MDGFETNQDDSRANNTPEDYCLGASPLEKLPMTLQIAMIAQDGWLLASDTRSYEAPMAVNQAPYLSSSRKIVYAPQQNIVYAYSGDNFAQQAGGLLLMHMLDTGDTPNATPMIEVLLRKVAGEVQKSIDQKMLDSRRLICLFLGTPPARAQLWTLDIWSRMPAVPTMRTGHIMAGVPTPAQLFPQLFYSQQKTVRELMLLAAHTLLMGAKCNPSFIDGLDMLVSDVDGTRFLDEEDLQGLRSKSDLLFRQTGENIFAR